MIHERRESPKEIRMTRFKSARSVKILPYPNMHSTEISLLLRKLLALPETLNNQLLARRATVDVPHVVYRTSVIILQQVYALGAYRLWSQSGTKGRSSSR